ncbi:YhhA family cyclophane-containing RiPP [Bradyrhizobium elkanii]
MPMVETNEDVTAEKELRSNLLRAGPTNPALQRLQQRLLEVTDASQVITSYDRMHHRHSRS